MRLTKDFLGVRLVQEGVISQQQLNQALIHQKANRGFLGKVLVDLGFCTEEDIAKVMAKRAGVPFVSLEKYPIDPSAVAKLPTEAQRKYKALPISFSGDKLLVAMQHPNNVIAIDDMRILTGYDIKPVVVADSEFNAALEKYSRINLEFEQPADEQLPEEELDIEADDSEIKPAVQLANMILSQAVNSKASDVHIEVYETQLRIRFRIDGVLHDTMQLSRKLHASLVSRIKIMANMNIAERRIPQDGRMSIKIEGRTIDARVASLPASFGERLTLRLLDRSAKIITLEELGLEQGVLQKYRDAINMPYGCVLVSGPTGSGKSTSLYASLINVDRVAKNVITVEDPVEYRMEGINQIQINSKAGLTFASGLRSILRSDPDIIMVGEIRDYETAKLAIESALTGHMVFSTLHTNDAAGAISRLTEMGIEPFLTASSIVCILAQRLARVLCRNCKQEYEMTRDQLRDIPDFPFDKGENRVKLYRPKGCMRCSNTGYRGRIGIYELLFVTETIQRLALERRPAKEIKETAIAEGMMTLRQDGLHKVKNGITSLEELMRVIQ
ncbi:type II secretion system protein E (GspE) [Desulfotomaculum arcticum]|uniref:Type II secretion system protein E (GspE) n=1 Tax=Desulfotruncus arcticus DSM 17038 TaxID=1121424 RepID=A0A1I2MTN2_9FIRM|nr:ATPase, T2SS/T4P/T4SS family [Desulfotruncus arcticus]SFF92706.1 type II secretion system protein E (GspE) [Desulfotomaculum arcticum] [Desulfotruncus arcticus DSM 17038]